MLDSPLADFQPASECGRASKAAALALYGKAALQCACDEDFASEKSSYLTTAIEKLTSVWGMRPFGELSEIPYNQIWDLSTQKSCPENIFQINYVQGNADLGSIWNYQFGPSTTGVTSYKIGQMHNMTTGEVYESFDPGDVRRNYLRATTVAGVTYYHTMKYADLECGANGYGGNNWIVLRYADVALMLAEAYYWQGVSPTAETYLNMVRRRAGLADWSGSDLRQGIYRRASLRVHSGGAALAGCAAHVLERGDDRALQRRQFQFLGEGSAAALFPTTSGFSTPRDFTRIPDTGWNDSETMIRLKNMPHMLWIAGLALIAACSDGGGEERPGPQQTALSIVWTPEAPAAGQSVRFSLGG